MQQIVWSCSLIHIISKNSRSFLFFPLGSEIIFWDLDFVMSLNTKYQLILKEKSCVKCERWASYSYASLCQPQWFGLSSYNPVLFLSNFLLYRHCVLSLTYYHTWRANKVQARFSCHTTVFRFVPCWNYPFLLLELETIRMNSTYADFH